MAKHVIDYIRQPETLDTQAIGHLRSIVDRYPYYHAARILMLKGMHEQHDSSFDTELRQAAIFVPSRKTLFQMFEAENIRPISPAQRESRAQREGSSDNSTATLIDNFLDSLPQEPQQHTPRIIDATVDYMAYLMQQDSSYDNQPQTRMRGQDNIDIFLNENEGKFQIQDLPQDQMLTPVIDDNNGREDGIFTETLARVYIKQGKFDKAIEIIRRLSLNYPKKNRYFADQIRFLEKLIINEQAK